MVRRYAHTKREGKTIDVHRLVWEEANGPVPDGYIVHHRDENKRNNELGNLELMTHADHSAHHNQRHPIIKDCEVCGNQFTPHPTKRKRAKTCRYDCARELMRRAAVEREARRRLERASA